jgi:exopolyphosphatase/pppGpp-phosphohydrolase
MHKLSGKEGVWYTSLKAEVEPILQFVCRGVKYLTIHDISHSKRLIFYIDRITDRLKRHGISISDTERFILYSAALMHDTGNISNRTSHGKFSIFIINKLTREIGLNKTLTRAICEVVISHSEERKISNMPREIYINRKRVRVKLLAVVFCIADLMDISKERAPQVVFELLKRDLSKESINHWKSNSEIQQVIINYPKIIILINSTANISRNLSLKRVRKYIDQYNKILVKLDLPAIRLNIELV